LGYLAIGQDFLDRILKFALTLQPEHFADYLAVPRKKKCFRQELYPAISIAHFFFPHQDRIVHTQFLRKLSDVFWAGIIHSNAHDLQPLWPISILQLSEPGHFDLARLAPRRPEVQQHALTAKIREMYRLAVERLQSKLRRRLSLQACDGCGTCGVTPRHG